MLLIVGLEISLSLRRDSLRYELKCLFQGLEAKNAPRAAAVNQLWELWKCFIRNRDFLPVYSLFENRREMLKASSSLVELLTQEKKAEDVATTLAMCSLGMELDSSLRKSLAEGRLAVQLVTSIDSHPDHVDVVGRGLQAISMLAYENCEAALIPSFKLLHDLIIFPLVPVVNQLIAWDIDCTLEQSRHHVGGEQSVWQPGLQGYVLLWLV